MIVLAQLPDVRGVVDVEGELGSRDHRGLDACRSGALDRDRGGILDAEGGLHDGRKGEGDCVQPAVPGGSDRDRVGLRREPVERLRGDERAVSHDDERAVCGAAITERRGDRRRVPVSLVDQHVVSSRHARVWGHHEGLVHGGRLGAGGEHVLQHRGHERHPLVRGEKGRKATFRPCVEPLQRDDRQHARSIRARRRRALRASVRVVAGYTVLCGGLGGSRLVDALARAAGPESVTVVGNVGDDVDVLGLRVSPDLDTVLYTLAGLLDEARGWGVRDETYNALRTVERLGADTWFTLGDRDIGLHLVRSELLRGGESLTVIFARLAEALGVRVRLLPASDDPVRTRLTTPDGELDFQTWFVRRGHVDPVLAVRYEGAEEAQPAAGVLAAIRDAEVVFLAPSNPFVSIGPILAVPGVTDVLVRREQPVVAVAPLVGGRALRGPLSEMLSSLGHEPSVVGVGRLYEELASVFVVDPADAGLVPEIEELGLQVVVTPIVMVEPEGRFDVGRSILEALG
jgi:LPPG:FO 2-phospho-L-lactate transferase